MGGAGRRRRGGRGGGAGPGDLDPGAAAGGGCSRPARWPGGGRCRGRRSRRAGHGLEPSSPHTRPTILVAVSITCRVPASWEMGSGCGVRISQIPPSAVAAIRYRSSSSRRGRARTGRRPGRRCRGTGRVRRAATAAPGRTPRSSHRRRAGSPAARRVRLVAAWASSSVTARAWASATDVLAGAFQDEVPGVRVGEGARCRRSRGRGGRAGSGSAGRCRAGAARRRGRRPAGPGRRRRRRSSQAWSRRSRNSAALPGGPGGAVTARVRAAWVMSA